MCKCVCMCGHGLVLWLLHHLFIFFLFVVPWNHSIDTIFPKKEHRSCNGGSSSTPCISMKMYMQQLFLKILCLLLICWLVAEECVYVMLTWSVPVFCCFCGLIMWISFWMNHSSITFVFWVKFSVKKIDLAPERRIRCQHIWLQIYCLFVHCFL